MYEVKRQVLLNGDIKPVGSVIEVPAELLENLLEQGTIVEVAGNQPAPQPAPEAFLAPATEATPPVAPVQPEVQPVAASVEPSEPQPKQPAKPITVTVKEVK